MRYVQTFMVHEFSSLFSDVHNPISLHLCFKTGAQVSSQNEIVNDMKCGENNEVANKWKVEDKDKFVECFSNEIEHIQNLILDIQNCTADQRNSDFIDDIV